MNLPTSIRQEAKRRILTIVDAMLNELPYFATLALTLRQVEDQTRKSIATDGVNLYYNPEWIASTPADHISAVIMRLTLACSLKHHTRRLERQYEIWQLASAAVTHSILDKDNLANYPRQQNPPEPIDATVEEAYDILYREHKDNMPDQSSRNQPQQGAQDQSNQTLVAQQAAHSPNPNSDPQKGQNQGQGQGQEGSNAQNQSAGAGSDQGQPDNQSQPGSGQSQGPPQDPASGSDQNQGKGQNNQPSGQQGSQPPSSDPTNTGEVMDSPATSSDPLERQQKIIEEERRWDNHATTAAQIALAEGRIGNNLKELIQGMNKTRKNWKDILSRYINANSRNNYTWLKPNPRFISQGLYLPSLQSDNIDHVVLAIDTSGSMDQIQLAKLWTEIRAISAQMEPHKITIVQCDTDIKKVDVYESNNLPRNLQAQGRGGTRFTPVFKFLQNKQAPSCLIYFTDLQSTHYPPRPPDYPLLWAVTNQAALNRHSRKIPYGQYIAVT